MHERAAQAALGEALDCTLLTLVDGGVCCLNLLKTYAQPSTLLVHELGEEFCVSTTDAHGVSQEVVVFRGLRLKCGLDCGKLQGEINGITGRMSYRCDWCDRWPQGSDCEGSASLFG